jgi:Zn-dependent peptidase ImmA (M78 family)
VIPVRPRYARIDRLTRGLLDRAGSSEPPVPVQKIAKLAGASLHYESFEDSISGVLVRNEHGNAIGINTSHPETRQRFTIAHEIGHLVLHEGVPIRVDKSFRVNWRRGASAKPRDIEEIEANAFAANLLMPKNMILLAHGAEALDFEDDTEVVRLAHLFRVSTQAMSFRLSQLLGKSGVS